MINFQKYTLHHQGADFSSDSGLRPSLLNSDEPVGLFDALNNRLSVERLDGPQIDDLAADSLLLHLLGRFQAKFDHFGESDESDIGSFPLDLGLVGQEEVRAQDVVGDFEGLAVHDLVLQKDHGIAASNCALRLDFQSYLQKAPVVLGVEGRQDGQPRHGGVPGGETLRVLGRDGGRSAVYASEHDRGA